MSTTRAPAAWTAARSAGWTRSSPRRLSSSRRLMADPSTSVMGRRYGTRVAGGEPASHPGVVGRGDGRWADGELCRLPLLAWVWHVGAPPGSALFVRLLPPRSATLTERGLGGMHPGAGGALTGGASRTTHFPSPSHEYLGQLPA